MPKSRHRGIRDRFNRILTSGTIGGVLALGVAVILLVLVGALIASIFHIHAGEQDLSLFDAIWEIFQRAIDPGQLDGELKWDSRILLLLITGVGILLISTLISIVNSTLERRIETLRRGRGPVEASDHVVILGWSETGVKVTEELAEAFLDDGEMEVVILSDQDPIQVATEVQEDILRRHGEWSKRRHVRHPEYWLTVRRGDITSVSDLAVLARLASAKSVIVLGDSKSDAETTKIILAIVASIQTDAIQRTTPVNIIAALNDNRLALKLRDRIHHLSRQSAAAGEPIAELIPVIPAFMRTGIEAQVARHRGLSEVYRDLLDFDGDELYIVTTPSAATTFGEVALLDGAITLGTLDGDDVDLWPSWNTPLAGKELIVLATSLQKALGSIARTNPHRLMGTRQRGRPIGDDADELLIIGWNEFAQDLVSLLIVTSPPNTVITVLAHSQDNVDRAVLETYSQVRTMTRDGDIDPLDDRSFIEQFDHVIVLSHDELSPAESDALVLADVLACRISVNLAESRRHQPTTVVAELRQRVNKNIAGVRLADDLLLSDSLSASAMAHLAVHPRMAPVLTSILSGTSPDHVQLMSIEDQSAEFVSRSWTDVRVTLAERWGELAIAIRTADMNGRVVINPDPQRIIKEGEEIIVFGRYSLNRA